MKQEVLPAKLDKARAPASFKKVKYGNNSVTAERRTNKQIMSNQICMKKLTQV